MSLFKSAATTPSHDSSENFAVKGRVILANENIPVEVLQLLPQETASHYRTIVFRRVEDRKTKRVTLSLATDMPSSPQIQELANYLTEHNGVTVDLYETARDEVDAQLARYLAAAPADEAQKDDAIQSFQPALAGQNDVTTIEQLQSIVQSALIPNIITGLINYALNHRASDVHIEPLEETVRVRYRVDGELKDMVTIPRYFRNALISRVKILAQMKIDEQRIPQDGRFEFDFHNHAIDVRVSTLPTVHGEKVEMRLLDKDSGVMTLEQLGITGVSFDILIKAITKPYGVVLATGPTGSGKTTTLYAILNRVAQPDVNVVTLEDPVEYEMPGINQSQVKPGIGYSFAEGLRAVLRQDPNVIMVGEIRDAETASMVTHAALTGHLVLSTLHTNDSAGALPRLINMGVEPFLITSSLNAIIAQRLVRKLCVACRQQKSLPSTMTDQVKKELAKLKGYPIAIESDFTFYEAVGCAECQDGYSGRIGIYEILPMSDTIESLAISKQPASVIAQAAAEEGMITMRQDGILKALKGITSIDEVWRVTSQQ